MTAAAKTSAAWASAAWRWATGSGRALRCAPMVRETYSGGTILSSATGTPDVLMTTSRLRVRYSPLGPSAPTSIKSAVTLGVSLVISVHAFDDGLPLEGGHRPHRADRIAELSCRPGHPDCQIALQI